MNYDSHSAPRRLPSGKLWAPRLGRVGMERLWGPVGERVGVRVGFGGEDSTWVLSAEGSGEDRVLCLEDRSSPGRSDSLFIPPGQWEVVGWMVHFPSPARGVGTWR